MGTKFGIYQTKNSNNDEEGKGIVVPSLDESDITV
jgi:hypothetical protein